jgi:hypothetical protein
MGSYSSPLRGIWSAKLNQVRKTSAIFVTEQLGYLNGHATTNSTPRPWL